MSRAPNIVLIQNDHQAYYRWSQREGIRPLRPHFERLASEGASFENAYCVTPLCGPARRSLLTGLFPHAHGMPYNYSEAEYAHEVYLDTLAQADYRNYYFGKWHAGPGSAHEHHCRGFSYNDYGNPYTKPEYAAYLARRGLPEALHRIVDFYPIRSIMERGEWIHCVPDQDYQCRDVWCGEHAIGVTTTAKETHESFFLANLACEALEELAAHPEDRPFMLRVDFWGPHQPHFPTQEFLDLYPEDHFDLPEYGSFRNRLEGKPATYYIERSEPFAQDNQLLQPSPLSWEQWKKILRHCFAHISMVDAAGGLILDTLRRLGLDDQTLVVWTTDHGDAIASHGGHFDKGSYMSEEVMRIPLAIRWPGVVEPRQTRSELISTLDIPVTLLDAAGLSFSQNEVHGRSLLPLFGKSNCVWREDLMSQSYGHGYGSEYDIRMLRRGDWKYVATLGEADELYQLADDPYELVNLAQRPELRELRRELQAHLSDWQRESKDPLAERFRDYFAQEL